MSSLQTSACLRLGRSWVNSSTTCDRSFLDSFPCSSTTMQPTRRCRIKTVAVEWERTVSELRVDFGRSIQTLSGLISTIALSRESRLTKSCSTSTRKQWSANTQTCSIRILYQLKKSKSTTLCPSLSRHLSRLHAPNYKITSRRMREKILTRPAIGRDSVTFSSRMPGQLLYSSHRRRARRECANKRNSKNGK